MKAKWALMLICGMGITAGLWGIAFAGHDLHGNTANHERMAKKIDKELKLTNTQKEQLRSFRADQQTIRQNIGKQLNEKRAAMRDELAKPESDRNIIDQLSSEIKNLMGQEIDLHTASILKMKEVLTLEQFKKFNGIMEKRRKDMTRPRKD